MSRFSITAACSVLVAFVAGGLPASADLVTFDFVVELTSVRDTEDVFGGTVLVGDEVTGQFTLDTSTPDEWPTSPNTGLYTNAVVFLTGSVGGVSFHGPGPQADQILISVPGIGPYEYTMTEDPFFLDTRATFRLWMQDTTRSWTSGDALPTAPYSYFDGSSFSFAARQDAIKLEGVVTSFTPEPGTLALLAMGIMVAAGRTRKRDEDPASARVSAAGPVVARLFLSLVLVIIGTSPAAAADPTCGCTDIVFVIDTTGSIDEAIASLADSNGLRAVVDAAVATSGGDLRVGLITFDGAYGGGRDYVRVLSSLTTEIDDVRSLLGALSSFQDNGGRWPEASDEAVREILRTTPWE